MVGYNKRHWKGADRLKKIQIKGTDLKVSNICFGGGCIGSKLTEKQAFDALDRYVALGGDFIDTAKVYCGWIPGMDRISETIIGKWLKERKHSDIVIATKGAHFNLNTPEISRVTREEVRKDLDESRKILGLDTIDFYWLHRDDETRKIGEIIDFMEELVAEGKIRYYGASNYSVERLKEAEVYAAKIGKQGFSAVSNQWSLASKREEAIQEEKMQSKLITTSYEQFKWHVDTDTPMIPYSSTAEGFFYKMYQEGRRLNVKETVLECGICNIYWTDRNLIIYNDLLKLYKEMGLPFVAMSIAYLLNQPFQVVPICGVSHVDQLTDIVQGTEITLPKELIEKWQTLYW